MAVRERFQHVPVKIARCAIKPVVDQFRDFGAPGKGTVKGVMIDPVLGKEARKPPTVATFDGLTERAKLSSYLHPNLRLRQPVQFAQLY
jgi:hypothetical protein